MDERTDMNKAMVKAEKMKISYREAEKAAEDLELTSLRVKKLTASAKLGQFIEQLGAMRIGRSTLLIGQTAVENGLKQCDDMLAKMENEGEFDFQLMSEVLKIKVALVDQLTKSTLAMMRTQEVREKEAQAPLKQAFPPNIAIGISVSDKKEVAVEEPVVNSDHETNSINE